MNMEKKPKMKSPSGGLEPPTSRSRDLLQITVERASQLRHEGYLMVSGVEN
ncbi:predicted protein [Botrytis cinerea T4]|uniref:Uncharacterized protein n=1 Tax=Botryotinia fuckeliana (strain T4) TaxID=999810 RepID=G2YMK4_BOTF4|nr:predicted protein [Botrytis cinerea T4]